MPWGQAGEGPELGRGRETPSRSHGGDQGGAADGGQAGQAAGKCERVDPAVADLPLGSVAVQLDLDGAQQPDLGGDLGGQILEGDGRMLAVQLQRGLGGGQPLGGAGGALLAVGGLGDQAGQPSSASSYQGGGVA